MTGRSRSRDRGRPSGSASWTPASLAGLTGRWSEATLDAALSAPHVVGEGPYSASGIDYPTVQTWASSVAGAPLLSQSTAGARPFERGEVFEAKCARGLYFKRNRALVAESRGTWDHLHDADGSTLVAAFLAQHFEAGTQTLVMTRGELAADGAGVWLYNDGAAERVVVSVTNAAGQVVASATCSSGWRRGVNVVIARMDPTSGGRLRLSLNGGTETVVAWANAPSARGTASANLATIGASATNIANHRFNGTLFEIETFSRALTAEECSQLRSYLDSRYLAAPLVADTVPLARVSSLPRRTMLVGDSIGTGVDAPAGEGMVQLLGANHPDEVTLVGPYTTNGGAHDAVSGWMIFNHATGSGHSPYGTNAGRFSDALLAAHSFDVIAWQVGINSVAVIVPGDQTREEEAYRNHGRDVFEALCWLLDRRPGTQILLIAPTSGTPGATPGAPPYSYQLTEAVKVHARGFVEIANALRSRGADVIVDDWTDALTQAQCADPRHPNAAGQYVLYLRLRGSLRLLSGRSAA